MSRNTWVILYGSETQEPQKDQIKDKTITEIQEQWGETQNLFFFLWSGNGGWLFSEKLDNADAAWISLREIKILKLFL